MSLLLDTHVLLWFVLDEPRLSKTARTRIIESDDAVFISPASLWEVAIKIGLGKYSIPGPFEEFWTHQMSLNSFSLLPISLAHTARVIDLHPVHRDPFDRLLVAQALEESIPIVSGDAILDEYGVVRIW